jgi:hypothetical protein
MKRFALLVLAGLAGCVLPPLDWQEVGTYNVPYERAFEICKEACTSMGYAIEVENLQEGTIETDFHIYKTLVGGQGFRDYIKIRLYKKAGGFTEVWVIAVKQDNENPGGPTNDPEKAHWGLEDNSPTTEQRAKLILRNHLRQEAKQ